MAIWLGFCALSSHVHVPASTTVARKLKFLAIQARLNQIYYLTQFLENPFPSIQLDEMETHEHTKFKPLSVALAVSEKSRKILGFEVSEMPAKGLLAKRARKKYMGN